jgi:hypothetical protein
MHSCYQYQRLFSSRFSKTFILISQAKFSTAAMAPTQTFNEIHGDLFASEPDTSLAHCISRDAHMGKGIAVLFAKKFKQREEIRFVWRHYSYWFLNSLKSNLEYVNLEMIFIYQ